MRRFLAPEVIQTSTLDCGPAALKSLLGGFGLPVSYGRLRDACQTALDGTSIDTMEAVANQVGLSAEQITVPVDHVFLAQAHTLPCIVVVKLATGLTHFIVVWRRLGPFIQVMDPGRGRYWTRWRKLMDELYRHTMSVPAEGWREWAGSEDFLTVLAARLAQLGLRSADRGRLITRAAADPGWHALAALDAATRFAQSLVASGALSNRQERLRVLDQFCLSPHLIPAQYWTVTPAPADEDGVEQVFVSGAVLVRALGRTPHAGTESPSPETVHDREISPLQLAFRELRKCGYPAIFGILAGVLAAAGLSTFEAVLFRSLFDVFSRLQIAGQRFGGLVALAAFSLAALCLEWANFSTNLRFGRQLEICLRLAFLRKLPKLGDRYFHSRLISDMAERSHSIYALKQMPDNLMQFISVTAKILFTATGLLWLLPHSWPLILVLIGSTLVPPLLAVPRIAESDLKVRTHSGALMRFYLDAMLGLMPIRAHGAAQNIKAEQEKLLGAWAVAALNLQRSVLSAESTQTILVLILVAVLLLTQSFESTAAGRVLLIVYWTLNIPLLGREVTRIIGSYPHYRNLLGRLVEPLQAPEEVGTSVVAPLQAAPSLHFQNVSVTIAGTNILDGINLQLAAGSHVAIVGPSGAGKSSLVSLLLGWLQPSSGSITVDGAPLDVERLRRSVAWVDPAIQLWNSSLLENITYGSQPGTPLPAGALDQAVQGAMLRPVLENLPSGLQTRLGEGGGLVSGGEGQRVRFARAALRPDAPLVILDEPFRGLDREKRRELLSRARTLWRHATLLCITHDIQQTSGFDQVVVIENGTVAAQGDPAALLADPTSRYAQLLEAERQTHSGLWAARFWRRIWVEGGRTLETVNDVRTSANPEAEVA